MGVSSSKLKNKKYQQHPYPPYPYPPFPYPPGQQYGQPPPGFIQQGFIPNGYPTFAQPQVPPQPQQPPQPPWPTQERHQRRKKTRSSSGHTSGPSFPQPQAPTRTTSHGDRTRDGGVQPPPLFTPNPAQSAPLADFPSPQLGSRSARHRSQTPFIPSRQMSRAESDESEEEEEEEREPIHYEQPRDPEPTMRVIQPMDPAPAAAYGPPPTNEPPHPTRNPLPPPPRDLYELTPYKTLFNLPQTTALLTASYGMEGINAPLGINPPAAAVPAGTGTGTGAGPERKKTRRGLFRAFSTSRREQPPPPPQQPVNNSTIGQNVHFVPVFVPVNEPPATAAAEPLRQPAAPVQPGPPPMQPMTDPNSIIPGPPPPVEPMGDSAPVIPGAPPGATHGEPWYRASRSMSNPPIFAGAGPAPPLQPSASETSSQQQQQQQQQQPIIRFDQNSKYAGFLNHSPHRILYNNRTYPSATHLHEAMKYIDTRPEIAELIRNCVDIHDVYPRSARYQQFQRRDWGHVFLKCMEEILFLKFRQHPDLRSLLLRTGEAILKYADQNDSFWGEGLDGNGRNELGSALMNIRRKLIETNYAP